MTADALAGVVSRINWWAFIALMFIGLYGVLAKGNLMKKIIGLCILQTAVILFFITIGAKRDATIPIIAHGHGGSVPAAEAWAYINPLPHVLMLTAIVVSVATLGVALALARLAQLSPSIPQLAWLRINSQWQVTAITF